MREIDFRKIKIEFVIPLFAGVLFSLFLSIFLNNKFDIVTISGAEIPLEDSEKENFSFLFSALKEDMPDPVLEYYRNPDYRQWVIDFFTSVCGSREIAFAILYNSSRYNVSPALAFALCWEESRFNPSAINRHNRDDSIDMGLFQLNNKSFPNLEHIVVFDIQSNAYYGIGHLRHCMNVGGTEVAALAMYNAGTGRVRTTGAPHVTLNYVSRILSNKSRIETFFHSRLIKEEELRMNK